jgi:hypothetical protein
LGNYFWRLIFPVTVPPPDKNMNPKQTVPLIATLAPLAPAIAPIIPALLIGGAGILILNWLFSDDDKEKKLEAVPVTAAPPRPALVNPSFSGGNSVQNRSFPPNSGGKPNVTPAPAIVPANSIPAAPKILVQPPSTIPAMKIAPQVPLPAQKKIISREDMAKILNGGRALTRTAAVAALKKNGFGKTAAYAALTPDGRFAAWLQFAPDGIITWKG